MKTYTVEEIERMVNGEDRFVLSDGGSLDNSPHHTCKIIIRQLLAERKEVEFAYKVARDEALDARKRAFEEAADVADKIRMNALMEPLQKMHPTQQIVLELLRKAEEGT